MAPKLPQAYFYHRKKQHSASVKTATHVPVGSEMKIDLDLPLLFGQN